MKISYTQILVHLLVNFISFQYERLRTRTRFEREAKGNSEIAYSNIHLETESYSQVSTLAAIINSD